MVVVGPNFEYGLFRVHISTNRTSTFAPSIQLTCLLQDGFVKYYNNQKKKKIHNFKLNGLAKSKLHWYHQKKCCPF
jgi:hypothetical protein